MAQSAVLTTPRSNRIKNWREEMSKTTVRALVVNGMLAAVFVLGLATAAMAQPSATLSAKAVDAATITTTAEQQGNVRIIVELASPVPPDEMKPDAASLTSIKARIAAMQDAIIASHFGSASSSSAGKGFARGLRRFDITPGFAVNVDKAEMEALAADPRVLRIHQDRLLSPMLVQSVPLIGMTGASGAYQLGATGANFAVAVVDTGVQSGHEMLAGKVVLEACFSNGSGGGTSLCPNGSNTQIGTGAADSTTAACVVGPSNIRPHGTHVAGIAAGNNTASGPGEPANGVAKAAKIVAVQVFTRFGTALGAYSSDLIAGLDWVFQNLTPQPGVRIASVNMSLGGGLSSVACPTDPIDALMVLLKAQGVATVIAAGNNGSVNSVSYPGCLATAVTVGSSDKQDAISSFSNMAQMVDLMAPGTGIIASIPTIPPSTTYAFYNGTSMATPHVAGCFAAIRTIRPNATVAQIESALINTGIPIVDTRPGGTQTKPRICCKCALNLLTPPTPPPPPPHQYRYQYVAKFVCGPNPPLVIPAHPDSRVGLGDYKTVINVHNPNDEKIPLQYKVALTKLYQDGYISRFKRNSIGADGAQAFDCNLFRTLSNISSLVSVIDGFFVIELDLPLDVIGYYTANLNGIAIHVEKSRERDLSRSPLCRPNVQIDLSVAGNWLRSDGNPAVSVPPYIGTPPSVGWDYARLWMSYGLLYATPPSSPATGITPTGNYAYELKFCSCSQSSVTVNGTVKSDDTAAASLNSLPVATSTGFSPSTPAGPMTGAVTFAGEGSLVVVVANSGGSVTGLSVTGALTLADGYPGACRN